MDWTSAYPDDPVEKAAQEEAMSIGQTEVYLGQFAEIVRLGKKPSPPELVAALIHLKDAEYRVNGLLLQHVGKLLAKEVGPGRPTSIHQAAEEEFRNHFLPQEFENLRREGHTYEGALEALGVRHSLSPERIRQLINAQAKS